MVVALRLAKAGYFGGDPRQVLDAGVDMVLSALDYETFLGEFEVACMKQDKGA